jgi:hypothetical protein
MWSFHFVLTSIENFAQRRAWSAVGVAAAALRELICTVSAMLERGEPETAAVGERL